MSLPIINKMAKRIRSLRRERLSAKTKADLAATRALYNGSTAFVCRCKEAEEGEHECPAFDFLQEQAKQQERAKQLICTIQTTQTG